MNLRDNSIIKVLRNVSYGHTSIPLLRKGKVGGQFWAAYLSCDVQEKNAIRDILEQIDVIKRFAAEYDDTFEFVTTANGILKAHKEGKIASLIGELPYKLDFQISPYGISDTFFNS